MRQALSRGQLSPRRAWRTALCAAALAAGLAACASDDTTATPTTPPGSPTTTSGAQCPVGSWKSTQVSAGGSAGGANVTAQGGAGVALTVGNDGAVTVNFDQMQPITFTAQISVAQAKGEFMYSGTITGMVALNATATPSGTAPSATGSATAGPTATATATAVPGATTGPWQPTGTVNFGELGLTVKLTEPVAATIADNVKIKDFTGVQTARAGNAVDLQPLLRAGTYQCTGTTLVITPMASGPNVAWTFQPA